ncbi:10168_t:CDS:2 [Ambispora gerdemannii]|uniref:10168_t:CDS:1 n=1 Tax=Ambispora gerdemannii TaxID=144530 RepID=A0A9N9FTW9_9GLOM|nr:10168_t:CDS:2 [Ambispora gerdemannii]
MVRDTPHEGGYICLIFMNISYQAPSKPVSEPTGNLPVIPQSGFSSDLPSARAPSFPTTPPSLPPPAKALPAPPRPLRLLYLYLRLVEFVFKEAAFQIPAQNLENVSLEAYIKYCEIERKLPVSIRLVEGKIIAYEVPLTSHALVAGEIASLIRTWNNQLHNAQEEDLIVGPNSYYTTDLTIRPRGLPRPPTGQGSNSEGRPYPTLIVEVGNSESVPIMAQLQPSFELFLLIYDCIAKKIKDKCILTRNKQRQCTSARNMTAYRSL